MRSFEAGATSPSAGMLGAEPSGLESVGHQCSVLASSLRLPGRHGGGGKLFSAERDRNTMRPLLLRVASDGRLMRDQSIKYMRQRKTHRHGLHDNGNTLRALFVKTRLHAWRRKNMRRFSSMSRSTRVHATAIACGEIPQPSFAHINPCGC